MTAEDSVGYVFDVSEDVVGTILATTINLGAHLCVHHLRAERRTLRTCDVFKVLRGGHGPGFSENGIAKSVIMRTGRHSWNCQSWFPSNAAQSYANLAIAFLQIAV